jgi:hypothetical protein
MEFSVAIDGIAIVVNSGNTVESLTMEQLTWHLQWNHTLTGIRM